jgi:hypothetical protein
VRIQRRQKSFQSNSLWLRSTTRKFRICFKSLKRGRKRVFLFVLTSQVEHTLKVLHLSQSTTTQRFPTRLILVPRTEQSDPQTWMLLHQELILWPRLSSSKSSSTRTGPRSASWSRISISSI